MALAKLWAVRAYFDPLIATGHSDLDAETVAALPAIRSAKTLDEYKAAVLRLVPADSDQRPNAVQRTWMHFDLAHSAFLVEAGPPVFLSIDMGGVSVQIRLSQDAATQTAPTPKPDNTYADAAYPSAELRILAAFKLWGAMHYFFAYRDLMDADWDDSFPKFLHEFIDAKDAREYHLRVAHAVTLLDDSNSFASSSLLEDYFGRATLPVHLRLIDKKPVVTEVFDNTAAIQTGDIVLRVDGEDIVDRINREASYLPASSHQALAELVAEKLLNGSDDSEATLVLRHHDGAESEVKLKRSIKQWQDQASVVRQLSPKIGYIDLARVQNGDIEQAFSAVTGKAALILDARGKLSATPNAIAEKLNDKNDVAGSIINGSLVVQPDLPAATTLTNNITTFTVEKVPAGKKTYAGRIVMLIDGRTIGDAERLGLYLEAARKVAFIGSDSAGACSTFSHLALPGGIDVQFSSTDVRHGNTGKLQRIGLTPAEVASPELSDVRTNRDVVLEKAVEYVTNELSAQ